MEGQLNQDDSILKVAVKTMKSESVHTHVGPSSLAPGLFFMPQGGRRAEKLVAH
jgi:hypothetical protein